MFSLFSELPQVMCLGEQNSDSHRQPGTPGFAVALLSDTVRYKGTSNPPPLSKIQRENQTALQIIFQLLV